MQAIRASRHWCRGDLGRTTNRSSAGRWVTVPAMRLLLAAVLPLLTAQQSAAGSVAAGYSSLLPLHKWHEAVQLLRCGQLLRLEHLACRARTLCRAAYAVRSRINEYLQRYPATFRQLAIHALARAQPALGWRGGAVCNVTGRMSCGITQPGIVVARAPSVCPVMLRVGAGRQASMSVCPASAKA